MWFWESKVRTQDPETDELPVERKDIERELNFQ